MCPKCNKQTKGGGREVIRVVRYADRVYRRKRCRNCGHIFTTLEVYAGVLSEVAEAFKKLNDRNEFLTENLKPES